MMPRSALLEAQIGENQAALAAPTQAGHWVMMSSELVYDLPSASEAKMISMTAVSVRSNRLTVDRWGKRI